MSHGVYDWKQSRGEVSHVPSCLFCSSHSRLTSQGTKCGFEITTSDCTSVWTRWKETPPIFFRSVCFWVVFLSNIQIINNMLTFQRLQPGNLLCRQTGNSLQVFNKLLHGHEHVSCIFKLSSTHVKPQVSRTTNRGRHTQDWTSTTRQQ